MGTPIGWESRKVRNVRGLCGTSAERVKWQTFRTLSMDEIRRYKLSAERAERVQVTHTRVRKNTRICTHTRTRIGALPTNVPHVPQIVASLNEAMTCGKANVPHNVPHTFRSGDGAHVLRQLYETTYVRLQRTANVPQPAI